MGLTRVVSRLLNQWTGREQPDRDQADQTSAQPPVPAQPQPQPQPTPAPTPAPAPQDAGADPTIVIGRFVEQGAEDELHTDAKQQTERFRKLIESFDDEKQEPLEWLVRQAASTFCYLAPFLLALFVGLAVGDVFSRGLSPAESFAIHLLSLFLELLLPILGLATIITLKRALRDEGQVMMFVVTAFVFLAVSAGNSLALFLLLGGSGDLAAQNLTTTAAIIARSFGPLILDVGCALYLSVASIRSLKKYLADQRKKIEATRDINQVNIELEQAQLRAAIERQSALSDMRSKQQRAQTWNKIEEMQSEAMIEQAKRNLLENGDRSGRYRYGGW